MNQIPVMRTRPRGAHDKFRLRRNLRPMSPIQLRDHLLGRNRNHRPRSEDGRSPMAVEEIVVLGGNDAADDHHDVLAIQALEFLDEFRQQGCVAGVFGAHAD